MGLSLHKLRLLASATLASVALLLPAYADERPSSARDLDYGSALFHFYNDNFFASAVELLVAEERQSLEFHADDGRLLLGGIYLTYGLRNQAETIFTDLLTPEVAPAVRDRAWLHVAEIGFQRGDVEQASAALGRIGGELETEFEARRQLLMAQVLLAQGRHDEAVQSLSSWRAPPGWRAYARYNLGVALLANGQADAGLKLLASAGRRDPEKGSRALSFLTPWRWLPGTRRGAGYDEFAALQDKINLALGFALLKQEAAGQAQQTLARVSSDGPWTSKARLGAGWAAVSDADYQAALVHWQPLSDGDPLDPAVQEARLGVPYALMQLGDADAARASYGDAAEVFAGEIERLDALRAELVDERFLSTLLAGDESEQVGWFWQLDRLPDGPRSRYLYALIADHDFQEALKNFRDLAALRANLAEWAEGVAAFRMMLANRRERFEVTTAEVTDNQAARVDALGARVDALTTRVDEIATARDPLALANTDEQPALARLARVRERLTAFGDDARFAEQREKYRLLSGTLSWSLENEFDARLWEARKRLRELQVELARAGVRQQAVARARVEEPKRFAGFAERIDLLAPRIADLTRQVDDSMSGHEDFLKQLALLQFARHAERLRAYLAEAEFALAGAYDRMSRGADARPAAGSAVTP